MRYILKTVSSAFGTETCDLARCRLSDIFSVASREASVTNMIFRSTRPPEGCRLTASRSRPFEPLAQSWRHNRGSRIEGRKVFLSHSYKGALQRRTFTEIVNYPCHNPELSFCTCLQPASRRVSPFSIHQCIASTRRPNIVPQSGMSSLNVQYK